LSLNDTEITDAGLKEFKLKTLMKISIRGCKKVTRAGLNALKTLNPKMAIEGP
jgi:hypothetical protein